jgi:hypothetical protein
MRELRLLLGAAATALLLAGCGGGSSGAGTAESQIQREDRDASMSIDGLIGFAKAQIASSTSDSAPPRELGGIDPPTSETAEPLPL